MRKVNNLKSRNIAKRTNAQVFNQGITYNEAGVQYNDIYAYGGVYGQEDILPLISQAIDKKSNLAGVGDFQGTVPGQILRPGQPLGPGFFLYITYPVLETT